MKAKHLLSLHALEPHELPDLLDLASQLKKRRGQPDHPQPLAGKSIAMIFSKSSTRTRLSFQVGITELGGYSMFLDRNDLQLGRGESADDTARVLSRYVHGVVIRAHSHEEVEKFTEACDVPVINALTDLYHPCQLLADLLTIREYAGRLEGVKVAYLGDGANNMARSWAIAAALAGIELRIGAPDCYQIDDDTLTNLNGPGKVITTTDPQEAVNDVDFVYTDVWVSMGFEAEAEERLKILAPYQVNTELMRCAAKDAKLMHCLPAYRGKEVTAEVLDGPASIIWDEAENRLHAQKAVLQRLIR